MSDYTGRDIAQMSIDQAVQLPGGNGLASPAFRAPLDFLGIYGWQHVEQGVETLICDGEVVGRTRFTSDWFSVIGRRRFLRRVLLQPAPLVDIKASALTRDQLSVTVRISVKYALLDPVHTASLQDPIAEIIGTLTGCTAELIRSITLDQILGDAGGLREELKQRLEKEPGVGDWYEIVRVLSMIPEGDERLIEVGREQRLAEEERGLVEAQGENELIAANYQRQIEARRAQLEEMRADREHQREMERRTAQYAAQSQQALLNALGNVAAAGMDPGKLAEVFRDAPQLERADRSSTTERRALADGSVPASDQTDLGPVEREQAALASVQADGHIQAFEVFEAEGELQGAIARLERYEVVLTCDSDYPRTSPEVLVRFRDGTSITPNVPWIPGVSHSLAQVLLAVLPQAEQEAGEHDDRGGGFGFTFDDEPEGGS